MLKLFSDPNVNRFLLSSRPYSREIILEGIARSQACHSANKFSRWILQLKSNGEPVGHAGLLVKEIESVPELELGYALNPSAWGRVMRLKPLLQRLSMPSPNSAAIASRPSLTPRTELLSASRNAWAWLTSARFSGKGRPLTYSPRRLNALFRRTPCSTAKLSRQVHGPETSPTRSACFSGKRRG